MIRNIRNVPGVMPTSLEYSYNPTNTARELFLYIEYIGHAYCSHGLFGNTDKLLPLSAHVRAKRKGGGVYGKADI